MPPVPLLGVPYALAPRADYDDISFSDSLFKSSVKEKVEQKHNESRITRIFFAWAQKSQHILQSQMLDDFCGRLTSYKNMYDNHVMYNQNHVMSTTTTCATEPCVRMLPMAPMYDKSHVTSKGYVAVDLWSLMREEFKNSPYFIAKLLVGFDLDIVTNIKNHPTFAEELRRANEAIIRGRSLSSFFELNPKMAIAADPLDLCDKQMPLRPLPFETTWQIPKLVKRLEDSKAYSQEEAWVTHLLVSVLHVVFKSELPNFIIMLRQWRAEINVDIDTGRAVDTKIMATAASGFMMALTFTYHYLRHDN